MITNAKKTAKKIVKSQAEAIKQAKHAQSSEWMKCIIRDIEYSKKAPSTIPQQQQTASPSIPSTTSTKKAPSTVPGQQQTASPSVPSTTSTKKAPSTVPQQQQTASQVQHQHRKHHQLYPSSSKQRSKYNINKENNCKEHFITTCTADAIIKHPIKRSIPKYKVVYTVCQFRYRF